VVFDHRFSCIRKEFELPAINCRPQRHRIACQDLLSSEGEEASSFSEVLNLKFGLEAKENNVQRLLTL
jgi:hypothetical protein